MMPQIVKFSVIGLLLVFSACKTNHLAQVQPQFYRMEATAARSIAQSDTAIDSLIAPYKTQLDAEMNEVIGTAAITFSKGQPESTLGNWMADLQAHQTRLYTKTDIDFAVINNGGIRIPSLQAGEVTRGKIFELMPFDNMLVVLHLDINTLLQFIQKMAADGGWASSAELRYDIIDGKANNIMINGRALTEDRIYKVSISDYVANGGSDCPFFVDKKRDELGVLVRDAIIDFVKAETANGRKLMARLDNRVTIDR